MSDEYHSMDQKKADVVAIQSGHCPECGEDLSGQSALAHAEAHWPDYGPTHPMGADATRRKKLVTNYHRDAVDGQGNK